MHIDHRNKTFSPVWFSLRVRYMSRGKPCTSSIMEINSISAMKAMWQWSSSHCSSEEPAIRAEACLAADVTPSSAAFNASNSRIQRQKVSRAKPSICEFKPSKLQKWRCVLYRGFFCQSSSVFMRLCCGCYVGRTGPSWEKKKERKREKTWFE